MPIGSNGYSHGEHGGHVGTITTSHTICIWEFDMCTRASKLEGTCSRNRARKRGRPSDMGGGKHTVVHYSLTGRICSYNIVPPMSRQYRSMGGFAFVDNTDFDCDQFLK